MTRGRRASALLGVEERRLHLVELHGEVGDCVIFGIRARRGDDRRVIGGVRHLVLKVLSHPSEDFSPMIVAADAEIDPEPLEGHVRQLRAIDSRGEEFVGVPLEGGDIALGEGSLRGELGL